MKKLLSVILVLCLMLSIAGCAREPEIPEDSYTVYYQLKNPTYGTMDSVVAPTYLLASGRGDDISYLLRKYLASTPGEGFVSPFPHTVTLISFKLEGPTAKVILSNQIAQLSGIELTVALICLTRTVMDLTDCREVIISANTALLAGQNYITLNRDSFLLLDDSGNTQQ